MRTSPVLFRAYDAVRIGAPRRMAARGAGNAMSGAPARGSDLHRDGPNRDHARGTRQQPLWDEHAVFVDQLVEEGFIALGGPLPDEGGAALIVRAGSETEVRERLAGDPWYVHGILALQNVRRWDIFIDQWVESRP